MTNWEAFDRINRLERRVDMLTAWLVLSCLAAFASVALAVLE